MRGELEAASAAASRAQMLISAGKAQYGAGPQGAVPGGLRDTYCCAAHNAV